MKRVVIIQGAYGYKPAGATHIKSINRLSGPIELEDAEAARLVSLKVAEYDTALVATAHTAQDGISAGDSKGGGEKGTKGAQGDAAIPEYNVEMPAVDLRAIGESFGLVFPAVGMTKAKMVEALDEFFSRPSSDDEYESDEENDSEDSSIDDGEEPPNLQAEDPVR